MDLDLLGFSLSIGLCFSMLGWACEARERFCQGRKLAYTEREALAKLVVRRAPLLRLLLLLGRAADDASDDVGCVCFARARHYRRDASLRAQRRVGRGARAGLFDSAHQKFPYPYRVSILQKYNMGSIDGARREDPRGLPLGITFVFVIALRFRRFLGHLLCYRHRGPGCTKMSALQGQHLPGP